MKYTEKYEFPVFEDNDIVDLNEYTDKLTEKLESATNKQDKRINDQIKNMTLADPSSAEIIDARGNHNLLKDRLNASDEKVKEIQEMQIDFQNLIKKKTYHFENIEAMKSCLTLIPGDVCQTLGYYSVKDGGNGIYNIRSKASDDVEDKGSIHFLNNNLVAELITENNTVNVKQFGAKGDGITDDTIAIQVAINSACNINFKTSDTYMVKGYSDDDAEGSARTKGLVIPSNRVIDLCGTTIKCITNDRQNYSLFTVQHCSNVIIKNGNLIGDVDTHTGTSGEWGFGILIMNSKNVLLDNLYCSKMWGDGIILANYNKRALINKDIIINNCICDDNRRQGMSVTHVSNLRVINCKFINTGKSKSIAPAAGVDIEPNAGFNCEHIYFKNCNFENNEGQAFACMRDTYDVTLDTCVLKNSHGNHGGSFAGFYQGYDYTVINSTIIQEDTTTDNNYNFFFDTNYKGNVKKKFRFENNRLQNVYLKIRTHAGAKNSNIVIKDNHFIGDRDFNPVNFSSFILCEFAHDSNVSPSDLAPTNCNLFIENNYMKQTYNKAIFAMITLSHVNSTFQKCIIKNNYIKYGQRAISNVITPCIIENNIFIGQKLTVMVLNANSTKDSTKINIIRNNIIENPNCENTSTAIINTQNTILHNTILENNYIFKHCSNIDDEYEGVVTPDGIKFLVNENMTGTSIYNNNVVLDNSVVTE